MDVLFIIVKLIRIFYNILYWLDSYCFVCIFRFLYHCVYIDFYSIVQYLDSKYIILAAIIISSIIYIYFCIMYCIYFRFLFTRAPIDSRAIRSDGTTLVLGLLFILNKGVINSFIRSEWLDEILFKKLQNPKSWLRIIGKLILVRLV